jgi:hypothetical protein
MTDTSFSSTIELLISSGFRLGLATTWGQFQQDENLPYQIYVNPDNFTLVAIAGDADDGVDNLKMYFSWKPFDQINKDFIFSGLPSEYFNNTGADYKVDETAGYDEFSDKNCTAFASLLYKRYIGRTDNVSLFGDKRVFDSFSEIWAVYTLISTYCPFYPWKTSKYICLVTSLEEKMFTYTLPPFEQKLTEQEIRSFVNGHIRDQKDHYYDRISDQKLTLALTNLGLAHHQFGII